MAEAHPLMLYNTLTRRKERFEPLDPNNVRMYVCGPTVYDYAHIGNARPVIVFDVLFRLLRHIYGADHVTYVRNITDVDDKINARAAAGGRADPRADRAHGQAVPRRHRGAGRAAPHGRAARDRAHQGDEGADQGAGRQRPRLCRPGPRAVRRAVHARLRETVEPLARGDGGRRARRSRPLQEGPDGLRALEAVERGRAVVALAVRHREARGAPAGTSSARPWPQKHLGEVFDIHGGGIDLVFPHHENEIAQSRCAHGTDVMARYWLHNGFLQVEGEKMSKSLGNFITIHDLLKDWSGEVVRFNMLRTHYRQPIDWTRKGLEESRATLDRWAEIYDSLGVEASARACCRAARLSMRCATISTRRWRLPSCTSLPRRRRAARRVRRAVARVRRVHGLRRQPLDRAAR